MIASGRAKQATIEAEIIRADGTRVPLGTLCYWHRNPLKRWAWRAKQLFIGNKNKKEMTDGGRSRPGQRSG